MLVEPLVIRVSDLHGVKRRKTGTIYANCCWHVDTHASLRIKPQRWDVPGAWRGVAHCFGCGRSDEVEDDQAVSPEQVALPFRVASRGLTG